MSYLVTSEGSTCDPQAIIVMHSLTMWAQRVLHVVLCLVSLSLEYLSLLGKCLYLLILDGIHYHFVICLPPLLVGIHIVLAPLSLALLGGLTTASCLVV